ncbi:MAG: hypothetical protein ACFE9Q_07795 [Candidatus Hodarchaeota archaeon]
MSIPNEYSKEMFKKDLDKGYVFAFKGTKWIPLGLCAFNVLLIAIIIIFLFILPPNKPYFIIIAGFLFFGIIVLDIIFWIITSGRSIEITPDGINWKGHSYSIYIKFIDIEDISYFPSPFLGLNTAKIFSNDNRKYKLRISFMTSPKNWASEEMIRTIIDNYWRKANPNAKYSTEAVSSLPSVQPKTISLIKPSASPEQAEAFQGYKCPNCLVVHDIAYKFCPKCGERME